MAPALPFPQIGIMNAGTRALGQHDVVAESGGGMQQPSEVALGSAQGRDNDPGDVSHLYPRRPFFVCLDTDGSLLTGQEIGDESPVFGRFEPGLEPLIGPAATFSTGSLLLGILVNRGNRTDH